MVKDQTARTAAETLRIGYFRLFGTPAYLVSDQGKAFTNGQVECMNQMIIRMIGKLEEDRKAAGPNICLSC